MVFKDYYTILGLNTNRVSVEEIKNAFREQAKKYHPDVNKENKFAEERFKDINEAYKVLSGSNSKRKYDRIWNSKIARERHKSNQKEKSNTSTINEMFNMFFGSSRDVNNTEESKSRKIATRGENIETEITIELAEAYFGVDKKISLRAVNGKMKTFSVKVPAGIRNGEKIRLSGQGKQGQNGGKNGDLFIKINIKDNKKFKLKGYDLETDLFITPWEAALGKRLTIPSIEENVSVFVPAGIESGQVVKIAGKGYKDGQGGRGDLIAEVKILVPKQLTDKEKELFIKLNELSEFNPRKWSIHKMEKVIDKKASNIV